jgi:hypothetical protein
MERAMAKKAAQAEKTAEVEQSEKAPQNEPRETTEGNIAFVTEAPATPDEPFNPKEGRNLV